MFFTNAFILSYKNVNEFDRRYSLLIEDFGRTEALVKNILKPNSRLVGHLEPPSFCWIELIERGNSFQLTQALQRQGYPFLIRDPAGMSLVARLTDFLNRFVEKSAEGDFFKTWDLFLSRLENCLSQGQALDFDFWESQVKLYFLHQLGFLPELDVKDRSKALMAEYKKIIAGNILAVSIFATEIKELASEASSRAQRYMA